MNTPIIANLIPRLRETVTQHLQTYIGGEGELSSIQDSLEFWWDGIRDRDFPELPMWSDLPAPDRDALFDAWIEAVEEFFALRRRPGGDPVASSLPVSVAPAASLSPEAAYAFLKEENAVLRSQIENHDATLEQVKACHRSQVNLLREKLKDCEKALERAESAPAASCASPAPLVPEVVKEALEGLLKALADLWLSKYTCPQKVAENLLEAGARGDAALTALRNYSQAPSPSVELLREARKALDDLLRSSKRVSDKGAKTGPQWTDLTCSLLSAKPTLSKLNAALA